VRRHGQAGHFEGMIAQELGAAGHVVLCHGEGLDAAVVERPPLAAFTAEIVRLVSHVGGNGLPAVFLVVGVERPVEVPRNVGVARQSGEDFFEVCPGGPIRIIPAVFIDDINLAIAGDDSASFLKVSAVGSGAWKTLLQCG